MEKISYIFQQLQNLYDATYLTGLGNTRRTSYEELNWKIDVIKFTTI